MNNFLKIQISGNSFLIFFKKIKFIKLFKYCNNVTGIYFDQFFFIKKINILKKLIKLKIFNNDFSKAYNCGNGIKCVSLFFLKKYKNNYLILKIKKKYIFCIKKNFLTIFKKPYFIKKIFIKIKNIFLKVFFINFGNNHLLIIIKNINSYYIKKIEKKIRIFFNNIINIEFVQIINKSEIYIKIFEIGVGKTMSCGSGIICVCYCLINYLNFNKKIKVNSIGGENFLFNFLNYFIFNNTIKICFLGYL